MNTEAIRENFLIESLFEEGKSHFIYSHYDRMVVGGVLPVSSGISLENDENLKSDYFLERREMGIINIGKKGTIIADGKTFVLEHLSCLYLGKGTKEVIFQSDGASHPAKYYCFSAPAHHTSPNGIYTKEDALPVTLGSEATANLRTIYKYIHKDGLHSCQVVMGLTILHAGSVWNTMPPHTHDRRSEVY